MNNEMQVSARYGHTNEIAELAEALAAAQAEYPEIPKTKEGKVRGEYKTGRMQGQGFEYKFKYADITDILKAIRPVLSKHKIAFLQMPYEENNLLRLRTTMLRGNQSIWCDAIVCAAGGDHQKTGAAMTYARRIYGAPMLGVAAEEDVVDKEGDSRAFGDDNGPGKPSRGPVALPNPNKGFEVTAAPTPGTPKSLMTAGAFEKFKVKVADKLAKTRLKIEVANLAEEAKRVTDLYQTSREQTDALAKMFGERMKALLDTYPKDTEWQDDAEVPVSDFPGDSA